MSNRRNWKAACGARRRYTLRARTGGMWTTAATCDSRTEVEAAVRRLLARRPGCEYVVIDRRAEGKAA